MRWPALAFSSSLPFSKSGVQRAQTESCTRLPGDGRIRAAEAGAGTHDGLGKLQVSRRSNLPTTDGNVNACHCISHRVAEKRG